MTAPKNESAHADADIEASRWLIALQEEPDDGALRAGFESWLAERPENAAAWSGVVDIYRLMADTPPAHRDHWGAYTAGSARVRQAASMPRDNGQSAAVSVLSGKRLSPRRVVLGVAMAAIAACLALLVAPPVLLQIEADYLTSTAELRTLNLSDGSTVRLGPDSALTVDFDKGERRVVLLRGEAFFEVTPDPARRFRVVAGDISTVVLGTAFDVRLARNGAAVAVRRGQVGVEYRGVQPVVSERLKAGNWMRVAWNGDVRRGDAPEDEVGSWLRGQIVARDRPLADIVDDLRRYYAGVIVLTDSDFGELRISGVYNVNDPVAALAAMVGAHGGDVRRISPWMLLITGR